MKNGEICYFVNDWPLKPHITFGLYNFKSTCTHSVQKLRTPEVRLINGIPFDEFESETEFKKLPKGWTYNTPLWEESIDQAKYEKCKALFGSVKITDRLAIQKLYDAGLLVKAPVVDLFIEAEFDHERYRIVKKAHDWPICYGESNTYHPDEVFESYEKASMYLNKLKAKRYQDGVYCDLLDAFENIDWVLEKYEIDHGGREVEVIRQKLLSSPRIWEYALRYYNGQILKGKRNEKNKEWVVVA